MSRFTLDQEIKLVQDEMLLLRRMERNLTRE